MVGCRSKHELAALVKSFGNDLIDQNKLSPQQTKALCNIVQCRTAALGGHEEACDCCGEIRYSYNSCGDRHCPKCQGTKQAIWVEELIKSTLPVKHYHIIFTVPHCLNDVCLWNDKLQKQKQKETPAERTKRLIGFDIGLCPVCKKGRMHVIATIPRIRSPAGHLPSMLRAMLK